MRPSRFALAPVLTLPAMVLGGGVAAGTAGEPVRTFGASGRLRDARPDCGHERFIDQLASSDGGATVLLLAGCGDTTRFHLWSRS